MQLRLHQVAVLVLLLFAGACADSPTSPTISPDDAGPSGIVYYPPEDDRGCDKYTDPNFCQGRRTGECITSTPGTGSPEESVGVQSCGSSGGGGGGSGTTTPPPVPPPSEPVDTCKTGDPVVDDPDVSLGLENLWVQSNPDANLYQRVEKAGWIVEGSPGQYSIVQWTGGTENFACGDYTPTRPSQGTVVGFVHTHPYLVGEGITDCKFASVQTYDGTPSDYDRSASVQLGQWLGRSAPLPGYIIDKDGYYRYDGNSNTATPRLPRCGY